ncbi:unnamed protein product [Phytomonas sp. Hart1]|nr:unnamed protein product [Phytomonas sp. Hart1]|eukprot:CCW66583.1 unnamed protein product [Phytomonas sp. isolate Hart1]
MITDAEFWMEIRRNKEGRDDLFKGMLYLIHAHQCRIDSCVGSLDEEEHNITSFGRERLSILKSSPITSQKKENAKDGIRKSSHRVHIDPNGYCEEFVGLHGLPPRRVDSITIRVLQQILLYAVPIYKLRYSIPAMSMGWGNSCVIDRPRRQLITFGSGHGVHVPGALQARGCIAGEGFFAILTNHNEVWASGGLRVSRPTSTVPTELGPESGMTCIATKVVMIAGHGPRLASLSRNFVVRSLSAVCAPTRSVIPSRSIRFLDLGYGDDYHMIGTDSILYKITSSRRMVSTPRRLMSFTQKPVSRVSCGMGFLLVIDQNGHLYTSGRNRNGQLGNGRKQETYRKPYLVESLLHHFITQVAAGETHALALTSSGVVYGAGSNDNGQLGLGSGMKEAVHFTPIPLPKKCVGIAAGPAGSMFICKGGQLLTCGLNDCMQLGLEASSKIVYTPTLVSLVSGVETYTLNFGGYLQAGQPSTPLVPNEDMDPEKNGLIKKNVETSTKPIVAKPNASIGDRIMQNGVSISLNHRNGNGSLSSSQALEKVPSQANTLVNADVDMGKPHEEHPKKTKRTEVSSSDSARKHSRTEHISHEPIFIISTSNKTPDCRIDSSVTNGRVSSIVSRKSKKVSIQKCETCCAML